jgi:hypothetical protein
MALGYLELETFMELGRCGWMGYIEGIVWGKSNIWNRRIQTDSFVRQSTSKLHFVSLKFFFVRRSLECLGSQPLVGIHASFFIVPLDKELR